jgi:hypothetical protein
MATRRDEQKPGNPRVISQFTLNELRGILSDEIDKIRSGATTAANVNAVSNATGKILSTIKLELEAVKLLGKKPSSLTSLIALTGGEAADDTQKA